MIAVVAVILASVAAGWPATRLAGVRGTAGLRLATSFLLGSGVVAAVLFLLSILGVAWSRTSFMVLFLLVAGPLWWFALKKGATEPQVFEPSDSRFRPLVILADLTSFLLVAGHALYATAAAPFETDFVSIWGLKGRAFAEIQGIDWVFLASPWNFFSHPDYPLLLPLLYDAAAVIAGGWDDRWLGLLTTAFGAAALLSVRGLLRFEMQAVLAAAITLALASMVLSPWIGMAEAPMIAYGLVSLLFIRRALSIPGIEGKGEWTAGAWLLACGAMTKNEGEALVLAAAAAIVVCARERRLTSLMRLWPPIAVVVGWRVVRALLGLESYLTLGSPLERAASVDLLEMARLLWLHGAHTVPWIGMVLATVVTAPTLIRRERFLLAAVLVQLAFYLAAYIITPHGMEWQIRWSWERLVTHLLPLVTVALLISVAGSVSRSDPSDSPGFTSAAGYRS